MERATCSLNGGRARLELRLGGVRLRRRRLLGLGRLPQHAAAATGACPVPVRLGSDSTERTQAPTAATVRAAPRLRLLRGRVVSQLDVRTGRSTRTKVAVATTKLRAATERFCASDRGWPSAAGTRMSMGQCHRYHEYDTRPITSMGERRRTCTGPCDGRRARAGRDDRRRAEDGHEGRGAREGGAGGVGDDRPHDQPEAGPAQQRPASHAADGRCTQGDEASDRKLPGPRPQGEERPRLGRVRQPDGEGA